MLLKLFLRNLFAIVFIISAAKAHEIEPYEALQSGFHSQTSVESLLTTHSGQLVSTQEGTNLVVKAAAKYGLTDQLRSIIPLTHGLYKPDLHTIDCAWELVFLQYELSKVESFVELLMEWHYLDPAVPQASREGIGQAWAKSIYSTQLQSHSLLKNLLARHKKLPQPNQVAYDTGLVIAARYGKVDALKNLLTVSTVAPLTASAASEASAPSKEGFVDAIVMANRNHQFESMKMLSPSTHNNHMHYSDLDTEELLKEATRVGFFDGIKWLLSNPQGIKSARIDILNDLLPIAAEQGLIDVMRYFMIPEASQAVAGAVVVQIAQRNAPSPESRNQALRLVINARNQDIVTLLFSNDVRLCHAPGQACSSTSCILAFSPTREEVQAQVNRLATDASAMQDEHVRAIVAIMGHFLTETKDSV